MIRAFFLLLIIFLSSCAGTTGNRHYTLDLELAPFPEYHFIDCNSDAPESASMEAAPHLLNVPSQANNEAEFLRELAKFQQHRQAFHYHGTSWPPGLMEYWFSFINFVNQSFSLNEHLSVATLHRLRISLEAEFQYAVNYYGPPELSLIKAETALLELVRRRIASQMMHSSNGVVKEVFFRWPLDNLRISSFFGTRIDPFTGAERFHRGIDLAAPSGKIVYAAAAGTVIKSGWNHGHGQSVTISHIGGFSTVYSHLSAIFVAPGQQVEQGSTVGMVGSTGRSTGPHLHFEIKRYNKVLDPLEIMEIPTSINVTDTLMGY